MSHKTIRFAQLSFWFGHANGICAAAQRHPNVELVCIWDDEPERGRRAAAKFGVGYIDSLSEVLQRDDIDAVGICSPTHEHAEHIIAAAESGKHCLVEKPFTRTLAEADSAIQVAETHQVQVMPVYNLQFTPANQKMKEFVENDTLGPIYQVRRRHGHREYTKNGFDAQRVMNDSDWPWKDGDAEGRRSLYHAGSHAVYWMLWMFGVPEVVVSLGGTRLAGMPEEDNNVAVFRYDNGMLVTLHTSETETAALLATELYGQKGALIQTRGDGPSTWAEQGESGALMHYDEAIRRWLPVPGISRQFQPEGSCPNIRFFDSLVTGTPTPITMYDGRCCMRVLAAAERADREKRQVELAEIE